MSTKSYGIVWRCLLRGRPKACLSNKRSLEGGGQNAQSRTGTDQRRPPGARRLRHTTGGTAQPAPIAALQPSMTRVWVLRQPSSPGGNIAASDPMVYVNGTALARSAQGTAFYHDFPPGTYRFTVQPYGTPSNYVDTLQLSAGMETYVQVEPVPDWEVGSVGGGSFTVASMSPQEAQPYLPLMQNLGPR